jgi:inner membrane protein
MDSLTQIVLGASVAAFVAPAAQRRQALLVGAALGTLPDLDVLIRYGDPIRDFTMHRGFSHSLLVLPFVAWILWMLWLVVSARARPDRWRWLLAFQLVLLTHPLLDALTVYGTQIFWPLALPPTMVGSMFIIDPTYTVWLLLGVVAAWRLREAPRAGFWLGFGLAASSAVLAWSLYAQAHIARAIAADQRERGMPDARVLVVPAPLSTLAWRIVVMYPGGDYYEGWYSFLAPQREVTLQNHAGNRALLEPLADQWSVQRLEWFTSGWYAAEEIDGRIVVEDLRMGREGAYVFRFVVGERRDDRIVPVDAEQLPWPSRADAGEWRALWRVIRHGAP